MLKPETIRALEGFMDEIENFHGSREKARELRTRVLAFYKAHSDELPSREDPLLLSGYGECLEMLAQ